MLILLIICCMQAMAQYKAVITNLNTKEEYELKLKEEFYFGTFNAEEVIKGTLEGLDMGGKTIRINNKSYPVNEIAWIDFKGHQPKKNTSKIAKILLYFGGSLLGFSVYEYFEANDRKTAVVTTAVGATMTLGALAFWLLPKQPRFDFTSKHLLEIIPIEPANIGTKD